MNDILIQLFIFILSLGVLFFGAEFALEGAEKIGKRLGIPPLVIGLILVGFGTSLPEFFVSHLALLDGKPEIAFGNIIGSNLSNILLILGIASFITPLPMNDSFLKKQLIFHFLMTIGMGTIFSFYKLDLIFFAGSTVIFLMYLKFTLQCSSSEEDEVSKCSDFSFLTAFKMILGFLMLYFGGDWLVSSSSSLCRIIGVSEFVISVILLAFGTSFPELVTVLIAIKKKKDKNLIVGNIIGSNVFNFILILGSSGLYNLNLVDNYLIEFSVLIFIGAMFLIFNRFNLKLSRRMGGSFLVLYLVLISYWIKLIPN